MKLVLVDHAGRHDIDARIDRTDATVADLARGLAVADPATPDEAVSLAINGLVAQGDLALSEAGLHEGATVAAVGTAPNVRAPIGTTSPELVVVAGLDAGARYPLKPGTHLVGRARDCQLVLPSATVSRRHCRFDVDQAGGVTMTNLSDRVGTLIDGRRVDETAAVEVGSIVEMGAVAIALELPPPDDHLAHVDPFGDVGTGGRITLNRPPRFVPPPPGPPLAAPEAPSTANGPPVNIAKRALRRDTRAFHADVERFRAAVVQRQRSDLERLRADLPHAAEVLRRAVLPSMRLWERRSDHPDFLVLAAGYGDRPWSAPLPQDHRVQPLAPAVASIIDTHDHLAAAPIATSLAHGGVVGIVGNRAASLSVARSLLCQAAVHHGPADLCIAVLARRGDTKVWDWTKWLPHTRDPRPGAGEQRFLVSDETDAAALFADLLEAHSTKEADAARSGSLRGSDRRPDGPTTLFVVDGDELLVGRNSPARQVLRQAAGPAAGLVLASSVDRLPALCTTIITLDKWAIARISEPRRGGHEVVELVSSGVAEQHARECAVALARYDDPELGVSDANLPELTPLPSLLGLDQLDAAEIAQRWRTSTDGSIQAPIGVSEAGALWLDLDRHGPHGLIGGTAGSGKSELVKTLVAAFAATYPASELTFGLFDFKGGSTFAELVDLPHTVGMASDLDVQLAREALRCLRVELLHRERLVDDAGVNDLAAYCERRAVGRDGDRTLPPMPRLIVIIDDFAAMANELADEIGALTDLTERGRPLGVHLLLATQKPSTDVDTELRINTRLRISLHAQDAEDSNEMIGIPDAAAVRQKGRGYLRVGQDEVVPFQSALSSGHTPATTARPVEVRNFVFAQHPSVAPPPPPEFDFADDSTNRHLDGSAPPMTDGATLSAPSDLTRLVEAIKEAHAASRARSPRRLWPEPLRD